MRIQTATLLLAIATSLAVSGCSATGARSSEASPEHLQVGVKAGGPCDENVATLSFQVEPATPEQNERLTGALESAIQTLEGVSSIRSETSGDRISVEVTVNGEREREQVFADLHAIAQRFETETLEGTQ